MKKILIIVIIVGIVIAGGWYLSGDKSGKNEPARSDRNETNNSIVDNNDQQTNSNKNEVVTFQIDAANFKYSMNEIRVKKGDRVKIVLNVRQGFHDLVLDEFGVKTEKIKDSGMATVEFVADKEGKFEYYCSVGNHRQMGMVGTLVVE